MANYYIYDATTRERLWAAYNSPAASAAELEREINAKPGRAGRPVKVFAEKRPGRPWLSSAATRRLVIARLDAGGAD